MVDPVGLRVEPLTPEHPLCPSWHAEQPNYDGKSDKGLTLLWIPRVNSFSISRALELLGKAQDYSEPYASQPMTAWLLWEMEEGPEKISLQLQGWSSSLP